MHLETFLDLGVLPDEKMPMARKLLELLKARRKKEGESDASKSAESAAAESASEANPRRGEGASGEGANASGAATEMRPETSNGAAPMPAVLQGLMRAAAKVMTTTAHRL